ncbi:hypothetical protein CAPTEDRAFT_217921 [Capitella teleta]|uniref:Fibrinogen C-terminal domain-containing protein n=1 Tax=Capitella teleta TaxID=283909 RepID=R7VAD5_CAPTE|nr:hypothetical protein CAPTEDRAFT_217921 [Capitella teleta]|eukprot:ELU13291.1 hypothetical protein CAPTEDRAFT_217921 [Capitella teleta]
MDFIPRNIFLVSPNYGHIPWIMVLHKAVCIDCSDAYRSGGTQSGLFLLGLTRQNAPLRLFTGFCEMDTTDDQWLVFQRRMDGSEDFNIGWQSYVQGFGDMQTEFWLGNEVLHALTASGYTVLRVDMSDFENESRFAEYQTFTVGDAADHYRMKCGGDSLSFSNGTQFSTLDADHDTHVTHNCAATHTGAFWYAACHHANPNGLYLGGPNAGECW